MMTEFSIYAEISSCSTVEAGLLDIFHLTLSNFTYGKLSERCIFTHYSADQTFDDLLSQKSYYFILNIKHPHPPMRIPDKVKASIQTQGSFACFVIRIKSDLCIKACQKTFETDTTAFA